MKNIIKKIVTLSMAVVSALTISSSIANDDNNKLVASAVSYETAYFPGDNLKVTQGAYNAYSHGRQNAFDLGGNTNYVAPFTGKIVSIWDKYNVVTLQSIDKVYYSDGVTLDYMTVSFVHDDDISDLWEGKVIKQGTVFYQQGSKDPTGKSGVHVHIAVKRGRIDDYFFHGDVYPNDAFYLKKNTKIIQTGGYNWRKDIKGHSAVVYDKNVKMTQRLFSGRYFKKYTGNSQSIVTALQSMGENSSYSYRERIAIYNGITNYCGSSLQNTQLLMLLKQGRLIKPYTSSTVTVTSTINSDTADNSSNVISSSYFSRYTGTTTSIVEALNAIEVDSSYSYRSRIAVANNINNYTGTSEQNLKLVQLLKEGKLKKPASTCEVVINATSSNTSGNANNPVCFPEYNGNSGSIVDALKAVGADSTSFDYRSKIAAINGISDYVGSASQNVAMLNKLKSGSLMKP